MPNKIKRGGHFGVFTGMWVFQTITLRMAIISAESQAKISLAFHFVERDNESMSVSCSHFTKSANQLLS